MRVSTSPGRWGTVPAVPAGRTIPPPIFFSPCRKENGPWTVQKKRAPVLKKARLSVCSATLCCQSVHLPGISKPPSCACRPVEHGPPGGAGVASAWAWYSMVRRDGERGFERTGVILPSQPNLLRLSLLDVGASFSFRAPRCAQRCPGGRRRAAFPGAVSAPIAPHCIRATSSPVPPHHELAGKERAHPIPIGGHRFSGRQAECGSLCQGG